MDIHILTHGRRHRQITYDNLPPKWQERVTFVIQERERDQWGDWPAHQITILPDHIRNLHQTRQFLMEYIHEDKVVEMDDDLVFSARRKDEPTKFRPMEPEDYDRMFQCVEDMLGVHPLVGVSHREGANRNVDDFLYATRQMRVHAYSSSWFRHKGYRWDVLRSPGPEDFCMILQVLTDGMDNAVCNNWVHNQGGSNTDGGVSEYRTLDVHGDACEHLAELYPDFVTVVEKTTKGSWGGETRKDVRIQWKKAYEYGRRRKG